MKIENRQQFLIVLVAAAAALLIGNSLIYEPLAKWWTTRSEQIVKLRKQVSDGKRLIKYEASDRARWENMRTNALPNNMSLAEQQVLRALDGWARDTGVTISGLIPQWKNDDANYMTYNCRVDVSGNMATLTQFLYDIEKDPMALRMDSVELSAHDTTGQQLTLGIQVSGLLLLSQSK